MPTLRELKKRLQGVKTTGKLAGAMRTVSTTKYTRVNSLQKQSAGYTLAAKALADAADRAATTSLPRRRKRSGKGQETEEAGTKPRRMFVLVSGNRGLSGGCEHELFNYFYEVTAGLEDEPVIVPCGKKAAEYCLEKKLDVWREFPIEDVPSHSKAKELSELLTERFLEGGIESIDFVYQHSYNMLKREPKLHRFLPAEEREEAEEADDRGTVFLPDAETVSRELLPICRAAEVYGILLLSSCAVQSATLVAMRSAYDNASAQAELLETAINRRRQQEVTSSVLETTSLPGQN